MWIFSLAVAIDVKISASRKLSSVEPVSLTAKFIYCAIFLAPKISVKRGPGVSYLGSLRQSLSSVNSSVQLFPPFAGAGFEQYRLRIWNPPGPHSTLHLLHPCHGVTPPWTKKRERINRNIEIKIEISLLPPDYITPFIQHYEIRKNVSTFLKVILGQFLCV